MLHACASLSKQIISHRKTLCKHVQAELQSLVSYGWHSASAYLDYEQHWHCSEEIAFAKLGPWLPAEADLVGLSCLAQKTWQCDVTGHLPP